MGIYITDSHNNDLIRELSRMLEDLQYISNQHHSMLVYPYALDMQTVVLGNYRLNRELTSIYSNRGIKERVVEVAQTYIKK